MTRAVGVLWVLLIAGSSANDAPDPCLSYMSLDGSSREKGVVTNPSQSSLCDKSLIPGWYRFTGAEIAMAKVDKFHCGAESTVWMDDKIPPVGPSVDRKFCFNHLGLSPTGCLWSEQVPVKNCGTYLVYQFPLKTIMCPMVVCSDSSIKPCPTWQVSPTGFTPCTKIPCPAGQVSPSGFEPCRAPYPKVADNVTLSGPELSQGSGYRQACSFTSPDVSPDALFHVTWSMDGLPVGSTTLTGDERTAYFTLSQWKGHINHKLTCSVQTSYTNSQNNTSPVYTSNSYYGGIKVEPQPLHIVEGTDTKVEVISTLPIECHVSGTQTPCGLKVHVISPNLFTVGGCDLTFTPTDWNPSTHEARLPLELAAKLDPAIKANSQTTLSFVTITDLLSGLDLWTNVTVPPIQVSVTDTAFKICYSCGDPHFVQSLNPAMHWKYNLYHLGHFNLAGDRRAPIAVQIETNVWHPSHLPVITALAVQIGPETVIIDTSGGSSNPTVVANTRPTSYTVQLCGTNEYQIYTSMGHRINIHHQSYGHYLDVKLTFPSGIVSLTDIVNGTDLYHETCYIDTTTNRLKTLGSRGEISGQVIDLFRVNPRSNLFHGKDVHTTKVPPKVYCSCPPRKPGHVMEVTCKRGLKVSDPFINRPTCKEFQPKIIMAPPAKNPPAETIFKEYQPLPHPWPTMNGITEVMARATCREAILNFTSSQCGSRTEININDFIGNCVDDVQASAGLGYVSSAVQAFQSQCETDILSDIHSYNTTPTGELRVPEVLSQCPNLCSMRGACVKSVCQCEAGWEWTDCSVRTGEPFTVSGITGGVLCDMSVSSDCFSPLLTVGNLGYMTSCTVTPASYEQGRPSLPQAPYTVSYSRENAFSLSCDIKSTPQLTDFLAQSYTITLQPQSKVSGNSITYVVYNGVCQMCDEHFTCYRRADACLINGRCYKAGSTLMIGQEKYACDPKSNLDGFTLVSTGATTHQNSSCVCLPST
ncbi:uncharacterized protein LOC124124158 isoform X2 [Haliotis rufescens]|uniref:uncharacterized protein LOC124124158 isoform X2 n=1 Tax=Haliotis rufescens TaxID=6454 RepID=UPI00201EB1FA|nr:uncharacterized protein LOC124124158 isoform X2 [Haliotis rufescens]